MLGFHCVSDIMRMNKHGGVAVVVDTHSLAPTRCGLELRIICHLQHLVARECVIVAFLMRDTLTSALKIKSDVVESTRQGVDVTWTPLCRSTRPRVCALARVSATFVGASYAKAERRGRLQACLQLRTYRSCSRLSCLESHVYSQLGVTRLLPLRN